MRTCLHLRLVLLLLSWLCTSVLRATALCNSVTHPSPLPPPSPSLSLCSGFRHDAHPMAIMVGVVGALAAFYPEVAEVR